MTEPNVLPTVIVVRDAPLVTGPSAPPIVIVVRDVLSVTEPNVLPTVIVAREDRLVIGPHSATVMRDVRLVIDLHVLPSVTVMTSPPSNVVMVVVLLLLVIVNVLRVMHLQDASESLLRSHMVSTSTERQKPAESMRMIPSSGSMTIRRTLTNKFGYDQEAPGISGVFWGMLQRYLVDTGWCLDYHNY